MLNLSVIRRFEFWVMLSIFLSYAVRTLLWSAWKFQDIIDTAREQGVPVNSILKDLSFYEHTPNYNAPFIIATVFYFLAWYLFHFQLFSKLKNETFSWREGLLLLIAVGLLIGTAIALGNVCRLDYRVNDAGHIIGLKRIHDYRQLFVLSDAAALFTIICVYEVLAQVFYKSYPKLTSRYENTKLTYILLAGVCAMLFLFTILWAVIPSLFYSVVMRQFWAFTLFLILVYVLQEYYFEKVYAVMHNPSSVPIKSYPLVLYICSFILGTYVIWAVMARFKSNTPSFIIFAATALFISTMLIAYIRKNQQQEKNVLQTQVSTKSAALSNLRSQINPHFLFNALNSLYALALKEESSQTADGIQKLGDMMRFMLHENNHERIPLTREIEYLHNYISIQQMRLDESQNIEIRVNIQDPDREIYIAPMLLNPFIENAFKHGISFQNHSWIFITLTLDSTRLYFKVHNSMHQHSGTDPEAQTGGIGLDNVKKRLELIYPNRHTLYIQESEKDYFTSLTLNHC